MAKLDNYTGSVELISGIKQKNNGDFPLMEAHAVQVDESGKRLDEALEDLESRSEETDPTVPDWAKQPNKPTYTASEVGALPDDTIIPIPDTASVGDAIIVEEVDENGKPIKFSAVSLSDTSASQIDETELNMMLEEVFT